MRNLCLSRTLRGSQTVTSLSLKFRRNSQRVILLFLTTGLFLLSSTVSRRSRAVDWNHYRIGDGIKLHSDAPGCAEYPASLVCAYQKQTNIPRDIGVLLEVLESFTRTTPLPHFGEVVVHLRLGDGLCSSHDPMCRNDDGSVPDCWVRDSDCWMDKGTKQQYAFSRKWYESVVTTLAPRSKIVIVCDMDHWTRSLPDPRHGDRTVDVQYRSDVANFFMEHGHSVQLKEKGTPDEDFIFMCAAKMFIASGGGLSKLVGDVVEARGGNVIYPQKLKASTTSFVSAVSSYLT